jgi:CxxC motif-containing protein
MRELVCIVCPNGCRLQVETDQGNIQVTGNRCKRGIDFAQGEITNPVRTLTSTVRTSFPGVPVLPVRTDGEIPREKIPALMRFLGTIIVQEPLGIGAVAAANPLNLGRNIIVTSNILLEAKHE